MRSLAVAKYPAAYISSCTMVPRQLAGSLARGALIGHASLCGEDLSNSRHDVVCTALEIFPCLPMSPYCGVMKSEACWIILS